MDTDKVREFVEFSKTMSFTAAAKSLHLSQPSLSKHIRDIEEESGVTLVKRGISGGCNVLTPAGKRFLDLSIEFLRRYEAMLEECRELDAVIPPARIQNVHHGFNIASRLRQSLEAAGSHRGNYVYAKTDLPICDALDRGEIDFAVHLEPSPRMELFALEELSATYGWLPLKEEPLRFLAGEGHPLFGQTSLDKEAIMASEVVSGYSAAYESWYTAMPAVFLQHGCVLSLKGLPDSPLDGGAYPVGPNRLCLCTERFAHYYKDLDTEVVGVLEVEGFEPVVYPFLVYRKDNDSVAVSRIVDCLRALPGSS